MSNFFDWTEAKVDNKLEPEQEPPGGGCKSIRRRLAQDCAE